MSMNETNKDTAAKMTADDVAQVEDFLDTLNEAGGWEPINIALSPDDQAAFGSAIIHPPSPNKKLRDLSEGKG